MGQLSDKIKNMSVTETRVLYDETSNNGLVIENSYIPEELLSEILCHVDHKSLQNCQLVCRRWNSLIQSYIWRKKAELTLGHTLPVDENAPWIMYYFICDKKPFNRNLIKNHSGKAGLESNWKIQDNRGDGWKVENPPEGAPPLPEDPVFEGNNHCFVTSYQQCWKYQIVDLTDEGFSEYLLDHMQPTIEVSEWYSCRWDCSAMYVCTIELIEETGDAIMVKETKNFSKILENAEQNEWFKFKHQFKNYGKGVRKIKFSHGGSDRQFWAGHYGSKMAGACIKLEIPESYQNVGSQNSDLL